MAKNRSLIILSGCGSLTGSDPYETVLLSYELELTGFEVIYATLSSKSLLEESAKLSKGKLFKLKEISPQLPKVVFILGGQGIVKNFLDKNFNPKPEIKSFLQQFHKTGNPIVSFSLGVSLISRVFMEYDFDFDLLNLPSGKYLVGKDNKFIISPATMNNPSLPTLKTEIENVVKEVLSIISLR